MSERTVFQAMSRRLVVSLGPQATVHEAACVMTRANCGSVLIIDRHSALLGIVTERDLMTRVLAKALDPNTTPVSQIMTPNPQCVQPELKVADAVLIDIRTAAELELVGRIEKAINIEWKHFPEWDLNPSFVTSIQRKYAPETVLILLCRSGIRSDEAATKLTSAGFENVFNVLEGFEGVLNEAGRRCVNGWKSYPLPWDQR